MPRHPHADLIKAYADDTSLELEMRSVYAPEWEPASARDMLMATEAQFRIKPPEKKVEMWLWVCIDFLGNQLLSNYFAQNEQEATSKLPSGYHVIQRADWTRIEVEQTC